MALVNAFTNGEEAAVHLTLRDHPSVATQSIGEEPNRRVVLVPRDLG